MPRSTKFRSMAWCATVPAIAALAVLHVGPAFAGDSKIRAVVELFTSQGCSSCPPADKLLKTYVDRDDVLALSFPVDYWDYLGWKDTFASPRFSERQRAYAKTRGDGSVYTPQAVINGRAHEVGSRERLIDKAIIAMDRLSPLSVPVTIRRENGTMTVEIGEAGATQVASGAAKNATVWLASVKTAAEVEIKRGENRGNSFTYFNVVRELTPVGMWTGERSVFKLDANSVDWPDSDACAVLVQDGIGGPIIGAAWMGAGSS